MNCFPSIVFLTTMYYTSLRTPLFLEKDGRHSTGHGDMIQCQSDLVALDHQCFTTTYFRCGSRCFLAFFLINGSLCQSLAKNGRVEGLIIPMLIER